MLNPSTSEYFDATKKQALEALRAYPQGMQIGGGVTAENAKEYLDAGASHVIVTSYVFRDGEVKWENLQKLKETVGKERIVLDLSCRKKENFYYIVTNRWQTFTNVKVTISLLDQLSDYCDEFLIHGVDVEGKSSGVELPLVELLAKVGWYTDYLCRRNRKSGRFGSISVCGKREVKFYNWKCTRFVWWADSI